MVELSVKVSDKHPQDDELQALEQGMGAAVLAELQRMVRNITRNVPGDNPHVINSRLNAADTWQPLRDVLADWLLRATQYGVDIGRDYVERVIFGVKNAPFDDNSLGEIDWDLANQSVIDWALATADNLATSLQQSTTPRIQRLIADWVGNSEPMSKLVERIRDGYYYSEARATTIAVTEITRAFAEGNKAAWREVGVIPSVRWNTAVDEMVCIYCSPLHRTVAPIDGTFADGTSAPPRHPRCRCWLTPVVEIP